MTRGAHARSAIAMGTFVTIEVVGADAAGAREERDAAVDRAFAWFQHIESCCSRFDPASELMQLTRRVGEPVAVSAALLEAVRFALAVAEESGGAFDPTIGAAMETRGFNREHRSGEIAASGIADDRGVSYRDVEVDPEMRTIRLLRPLVLDLGAVAKGLAIDMAARELRPFGDFAVDAGGDLYLGGRNADGQPWRIGIRHPREDHAITECLSVSNRAVCTSGDYERHGTGGAPHILDPRTRAPACSAVSATAIAETAMLADAAATAAYVLGPEDGVAFLERLGVEGVIMTAALERFTTRGFRSESGAAILPDPERAVDDCAGRADRDRGAGRGH